MTPTDTLSTLILGLIASTVSILFVCCGGLPALLMVGGEGASDATVGWGLVLGVCSALGALAPWVALTLILVNRPR